MEKTYIREKKDGRKDAISKGADRAENRLTVMCMPKDTVTAKRSLTGPGHGICMRGIRLRPAGAERFPTLSDTGFTVS